MDQLEIFATSIDGVLIVAPVGEIDLVTAPILQDHLHEQLSAGPTVLVIRLDLVSFIDSSGVRALVSTYHRAQAQLTELRLAAPGDLVRKVLELTHVDQLIPTYTYLRDARRADTPDQRPAMA